MKKVQEEFHDFMFKKKMFHCKYCKERWFNMHCGASFDDECLICEEDRERNNDVRKMGNENRMDPYPYGFPQELPKLSQIEEMMIARVHVIMSCYRLEAGTVGYKGSVLNCEQDPTTTINNLPTSPHDIPVVIIRKINVNKPENYKDFRVKKNNIITWLDWLKKNNPLYSDIHINEDLLKLLPYDGNVGDMLKEVTEEENELDEDLEEQRADELDQEKVGIEQGFENGDMDDKKDYVDEHYLPCSKHIIGINQRL